MRATVAEVNPPTLTIVGPENKVRPISDVDTDLVDVRALEPGGHARTVAYSPDPRVSFTTTPTIAVRIELVPADKK
jgi:hypothetical protein